MKLRIRGNAIRLRLKRSEVEQLAAGNKINDRTEFPHSVFGFSLDLSENDDMLASFENGTIAVSMPRVVVPEWAGTDLVSLYSEQKLPNGAVLTILVEKDFNCLEPGQHRNREDDRDTYAHPSA